MTSSGVRVVVTRRRAPQSTPAMTRPAPAAVVAPICSPSSTADALSPTTGTSIENGATTPAGCRAMSQVQTPEPASVPTSTV